MAMGYRNGMCRIVLTLFGLLAIIACKETVDTSARYVFNTNTVLSYLEKHEEYSEYVDLMNKVKVSEMSESSVAQLMSARGHYTVFAPTNEAIHNYLLELVDEELIATPSWEAFTDSAKLDSIRRIIICNSIIDGGDEVFYETSDFPVADNSEISISNMNGRKLTVHYVEDEPDSIYIDGDCPINQRNRDIYVLNGIIHQMEKVVAPTIISLGGKLREVIDKQEGPYLVTARCILSCGYMDTLDAVRDEGYERLRQTGVLPSRINATSAGLASVSEGYAYAPEHRKYGFTIFAEPDERRGSNQGDELKGVGRYEVVLKLPPVPRRGVYELRYRVLATTARGVAQLYFGDNLNNLPVVGIPVDLVLCGDASRCGESGVRRCAWEPDSGDDDYDAEIDKRMRNNGFMKGELGLWNGTTGCRSDGYKHIIRHLVTRQLMDPDKTYYIKFKSVLDSDRKELYLDTIELCPKEVYDNPETPEDIW